MAVYYRYRSGVDTFSVPVPGPSVTVAELKRLIMATARHGHGRTRGRGPRESVALSDAQTGEELADDAAPVQRNATVLVRRVAGPPVETIVTALSPCAPKSAQQHARVSSSSSSATSSASTAGRSRSPSPSPPAIPAPAPMIPAELHCKICKNVMVDAVLASRCCFDSFCDRCVRDRITASSRCACGALARADDLIPNPAIRTTIANLLSASGGITEKPRSSVGSNATPTPAASQESNVTFEKKGARAASEHSDGSGSSSTSKTTTTPAAREPKKQPGTSTGTAGHADYNYGGVVPLGPASYGPYFGGAPWVPDPYMYYGVMAYHGGGGYTMPAGPPQHFGAMPAPPPPQPDGSTSYGHHGRKRTDHEDRSHEERSFKRRCESQVAV